MLSFFASPFFTTFNTSLLPKSFPPPPLFYTGHRSMIFFSHQANLYHYSLQPPLRVVLFPLFPRSLLMNCAATRSPPVRRENYFSSPPILDFFFLTVTYLLERAFLLSYWIAEECCFSPWKRTERAPPLGLLVFPFRIGFSPLFFGPAGGPPPHSKFSQRKLRIFWESAF